jgi:hypothetical protein
VLRCFMAHAWVAKQRDRGMCSCMILLRDARAGLFVVRVFP